jgi:hypothetical protein
MQTVYNRQDLYISNTEYKIIFLSLNYELFFIFMYLVMVLMKLSETQTNNAAWQNN